MPPAVEPADAPKNIKMTITPLANEGHISKLAVEYPVVDIIVATWNSDNLKVCSTF
jgi:hypothetical protein